MPTTIEVNAGYLMTPCMSGQPKKLCYVYGRQGNAITVMVLSGITVAYVQMFEREYAKVKTVDGVYNLMPCNKVHSMDDIAEVCDIIRNCPE